MKFVFAVLVFFWIMSGAVGAWMNDDLNADHWKEIARGPITLANAVNDHPASIPSM
jgi:hypothetical protein